MKISKSKVSSGTFDNTMDMLSAEEMQLRNIHGLRILVVDDQKESAKLLALILKNEGADARWVTSVAEAFEVIDSFHPSIIVSDLSMPQEDGFDLIRKFRLAHRLDEGGFVPAIAVSADGSEGAMQRSFEYGYQGFFPKPVEQKYLIEAIASMALVHRMLSDNFRRDSMPLSGSF